MAESKRIQLEPPTPLQKDKKSKEWKPTYRFDLTLEVSNKDECPQFWYKDLLRRAEASNRAVLSDDDDEKLQEIARGFEEKYNPKPGRKRKKKNAVFEEYVDRGMGYDETDSFIDNGEAYDEYVPSNHDTEYGGFYINKGELEFRVISESDSGIESKIKKKRRKQKETFAKDAKKRKRIPIDDENRKRRGRKPASETVSALPKPKKKTQQTVADMLQQHKAQMQIQQQEKLQQIQCIPIVVERNLDVQTKTEVPEIAPNSQGLVSTIHDAIESVVKAAAEDAVSNGSGGPITGSSDGEEITMKRPVETIEAPKLPENLPADLDSLVAQLKEAAYNSEEGKCKFFSEDVNRMLLNVELKSQELTSAQRSIIYCHLASHLPCTKETLQKRAKKLRLDQEDNKLREPMQKLKDAIAAVMPEMCEKYASSLRASDLREGEKVDSEVPTQSDEDSQEQVTEDKKLQLKKKFEWSDTIRKYLCDVVRIKLKCYEVSKTRIQSAEEYLKHFLEAEVRHLWPPGWMQARTLFKESREAHSYITNRQKKSLLLPKKSAPNQLPSSVMVAVKPAVSVLNSAVLSQETNHTEPASQTDRSVPSTATMPLFVETAERNIDISKVTGAVPVVELRQAEFAKLLSYPIKNNTAEIIYPTRISSSTDTGVGETPVPPKDNPSISSLKLIDPHLSSSAQTQNKQSVLVSNKISDLNTFTEGSLASDMLARIICASLADFPYAGSSTSENVCSKTQSVITSSPSFSHVKDTRVNSKLPVDSFTSPKRLEDLKSFHLENRKTSHESGSHNLLSGSQVESILNTHHNVKPSENVNSSTLVKPKTSSLEVGKSAVNLKLKDVMPQSRQFAEAFEMTADQFPFRKKQARCHTSKRQSTQMGSMLTSTVNSSAQFSTAGELLTASSVSASNRTFFENTPRMAQDIAAKLSAASQGPPVAPYKKRTKYSQSSKSVESWSPYIDATSLGASLLEGMKGFPFPVSTLPTPPPAHCSNPLKTSSHIKDSTYGHHTQHNQRAGSLLSPGQRVKESRPEMLNHSQQSHVRLPVVDGPRRPSLIKGPWKSNPATQASSTSHTHYLASSSASLLNPRPTSPSQSVSSHPNPTIVYAHSRTSPEKSPVFSHNQTQLPLRASPSPVQGHSSRTPPSNATASLVTQTFLAHQTGHTVTSHQSQVHPRSSTPFDHNLPSTTSNSLTGNFSFNQEQKTIPRTN